MLHDPDASVFHVKHTGRGFGETRYVNDMRLRVCTYNIHGGTDEKRSPSLPAIADSLLGVQADVILLQEVDRFLPRSQFSDQATWLSRRLRMRAFFYGRLRFGPAAFGNALLVRDGTPTGKVTRLPLPASGGEPRCAVGVLLPEHRCTVWSVHLGLSDDWQATQLERLAESTAGADDPPFVVVGGDFNARLDAPEVDAFLSATRFDVLSGEEPTFPASAPAHRIDFLFGRGVTRLAGGAIAGPGSDHCLVWADLELPDRE